VNATACALAGLGVIAVAAAWHGVTEHHVHLAWFWRHVRPGTVIPATRHDAAWHAMGHGRRAVINAGMLAAAALAGLGWTLRPRIAAIALAAVALAVIAQLAARALARVFGIRRPHDLED